MSVTDLNILTDAVTFAVLAALGGVIAYVVVRTAWRHIGGPKALKLGLSAGSLVAILFAGVAMWPVARSGAGTAIGVTPDPGTPGSQQSDELANPVPAPGVNGSKIVDPARALGTATPGPTGQDAPATGGPGGTDGGPGPGGGGGSGGGGPGGGGGGGGNPSPSPSPSPTPSPDPSPSPSPSPDPSPSPSPSPSPDPSPSEPGPLPLP